MICAVCEKRLAVAPDCLCAECRAWVAQNTVEVTDPVERILSAHQPLKMSNETLCLCTESFEGPAHQRRHVAELIYHALYLDGPTPWTKAEESR